MGCTFNMPLISVCIEMTLTNRGCNSTDNNEPPVYSDLEERYQDLDNSELERNFPNPLYSEHKLDLEDSYFDNSIYVSGF